MPSNTTTTVIGGKGLIKYLNELKVATVRETKTAIRVTAIKIENDYIRGVRGNKQSGDLENSIDHDIAPGGMSATIGSTAEHSIFIEFGTRPHIIKSKGNYSLSDGVDYFGKTVNHPGTAANPALRRAFLKHAGARGERLAAAILKELNRPK